MPIFLDPRGRSTYGIALCARCSRKMFLDELYPDPNSPGLMVCRKDLDVLDPYRLPARQVEQINLPFYRPDVELTDRLTFGLGLPTAPGYMSVFNILAQRLVDDQGRAILTHDGQYIVVQIAPNPMDLPGGTPFPIFPSPPPLPPTPTWTIDTTETIDTLGNI